MKSESTIVPKAWRIFLRIIATISIGCASIKSSYLVDLVNPAAYTESQFIIKALPQIKICLVSLCIFSFVKVLECFVLSKMGNKWVRSLDVAAAASLISLSVAGLYGLDCAFLSHEVIRATPYNVAYSNANTEIHYGFRWMIWFFWATSAAECGRSIAILYPSRNRKDAFPNSYSRSSAIAIAVTAGSFVFLGMSQYTLYELLSGVVEALPNSQGSNTIDFATWLEVFKQPCNAVFYGLCGTGIGMTIYAVRRPA